MKRLIALILALTTVCSFTACANNTDSQGADGQGTVVVKMGVLPDIADSGQIEAFDKHLLEEHRSDSTQVRTYDPVKYDSLSAMLLGLKSDKIVAFGINEETAKYIIKRNDDMKYNLVPTQKHSYSMVTLEENTEFYDILNNAIIEIKADGTMDKLIAEQLTAYVNSDPAPAEMPVFEGAETYTVAVTGDLPPLDFVSADGKPAGFNIALLSEIANRAEINIKLIVVEAGARASALASGKADAYFWTITGICPDHPEMKIFEDLNGSRATEAYLEVNSAVVSKK